MMKPTAGNAKSDYGERRLPRNEIRENFARRRRNSHEFLYGPSFQEEQLPGRMRVADYGA
jgi:hypothetical protein